MWQDLKTGERNENLMERDAILTDWDVKMMEKDANLTDWESNLMKFAS